MLQATPLDIAFTTMIIPSDFDADARHRRRERRTGGTDDADDAAAVVVKRPRPRRPRSDFFELECENPVADMSNGGPRCAAPRAKRATHAGTCPHCMQALSAGQGAAGLPYANDEPVLPNSRLVNDILRPADKQPAAASETPRAWQPMPQPPQQQQQQQSPSRLFDVVETWPFNQVKPEVFYAILVILGVLVILHMDAPPPRRHEVY